MVYDTNKLDIVKNIDFKFLTPWDKWFDNYESYRVNIEKIHTLNKVCKILVWNCQSLNKNKNNRMGKIELVRNVLNNNNNIDFIFLIDVKNIEFMLLEGYSKFTDNRNILFIKSNIVADVRIMDNFFKVNNDFVFAYLVPNADIVSKNRILNEIMNNTVIFGDLNIKSNKEIFNCVNEVYGENTLQTVLINKKPIKYKKINAPSDHVILLYDVYLKINLSSNLKLCEIDEEVSKKTIKKILNGEDFRYKPKIKIRKYNYVMSDRERVNDEILEDYINNNVSKAYKKYSYLWKGFRREPFLGTKVNQNIIDTFAVHLKANKNKVYRNIEIDENIKFIDNDNKFYCKSVALNYDYIKLRSICKAINEYIDDKKKRKEFMKIENIITNVLRWLNKMKFKLRANTFFLMKDKKLENFNHVRMIIIMPTLIKIYESLIINEVQDYLSNLIISDKYQWGGVSGGSTYRAMYNLREKCKNLGRTKALILFDMIKGYDSVDLDILSDMVLDIQDKRVKYLINNWIVLAKNLDIVMNNDVVKKGRGVPMGLSMSPIMFVYYVHIALKNVDKSNLVLYMDDIAMIIPESFNNNKVDVKINELIENLSYFDLVINKKKSVFISNDPYIIQKYSTDYVFEDSQKYLGRELKIGLDNNVINDDRFYFDGKYIKGTPAWINFAIKRLIYNGALDARLRFKFYMWPTSDKEIRKALWEKAMKFYRSYDSNYSYVQMTFVSTNIFRYMLDPFLIKDCYIDLLVNNIDINIVNNKIKENLRTGKHQIDPAINELHELGWNRRLQINDETDWLDVWKKFCDKLWGLFMDKIYIKYMNVDNGNLRFHGIRDNSKFIKNFRFINDLIFNHVNRIKTKQIMMWRFLDYVKAKYTRWKYDTETWYVQGELNFDDIDLKKDIFESQGENWEIYAKNKNRNYWPLIRSLFDLENRVKTAPSAERRVKKNLEGIGKKLGKSGLDELSKNQIRIVNMSQDELDEYVKTQIEVHKENDGYLKNGLKAIIKLFLIFDTVYGDRLYNHMNIYELRLNLLLKFDNLRELADKIWIALNKEELLEFY